MKKTLCTMLVETLKALPEGIDEAAVLKLIFESERKKNALLDRIILQQTSCTKELMGLVRWIDSLRWNVRAEEYPLDKDLKSLVDTGEWVQMASMRTPSSYVQAECTYEPAGMWGILAGIMLIVLCGMFALFVFESSASNLLKQFEWENSMFVFGIFAVGSGFLMGRSISKSWIDARKEVVKNALYRAEWLDEKIQLAYEREQS